MIFSFLFVNGWMLMNDYRISWKNRKEKNTACMSKTGDIAFLPKKTVR